MEEGEYKYSDVTQKITGCSMKAHTYFGPGFPEIIYQRALLIELQKIGLTCESEVEKNVCYEGVLVGKRRLDVIVEDKVLVELKALGELDAASYNKILNHLHIFSMEAGLCSTLVQTVCNTNVS